MKRVLEGIYYLSLGVGHCGNDDANGEECDGDDLESCEAFAPEPAY